MQAKHLVPNAVTLANIGFGFAAIIAAADGKFERACVLLFFGALCDLFDGRLARMLDASSKFGMELDSLSDVISFGIAPAVLVYLAVLRHMGPVGGVAAVIYVLCGALRLARYNTSHGPLADVTFLGTPIPIAAGYILSLVMVRNELPGWLVTGAVVAIAGGMVSTLKVPKFRAGQGLPGFMLLIGIGAFVAFLARPMALTWHLWNGWNLVLLVANYVMLSRQGHLRRDHHELERAA